MQSYATCADSPQATWMTELVMGLDSSAQLQRVQTTRLWMPGVFSTAVSTVPVSGRGPSGITPAQQVPSGYVWLHGFEMQPRQHLYTSLAPC